MEHQTETIVKNTALYTGAVIGQKALSFLYFWFLSSRFGPGDLGGYLWALSMVGLFGIGIDFGLTAILTREAARHDADASRLVRAVLALKVPLAAVTVSVFAAVVLATRPSAAVYIPAGVGILICDAFTMVFFAALRARQALSYEATALLIFQLVVFTVGAALTIATRSLPAVILALFAGSAFNLAFMARAARRVFGSALLPAWDRTTARHLLALIPAFAGGIIFTKFYQVADVVLLGYLAGDREVGLYSIPAKIATALQTLLPGAFAAVIYPSLSNYFTIAPDKFRTLFEKSAGYLLVAALPIAAGLVLLSRGILSLIWPAYVAADAAFVGVMVGVPFMFLTFPTGSLLNAAGRQRRNAANRAAVTAANILLNIALIPRWGALGAAAAFSACNALLFVLDAAASRGIVRVDWRGMGALAGRAAAATVVMSGLVALLRDRLPLPAVIAIGGAAYAALAVGFRIITASEWRALRELARRREPSAVSDL